MAKTPTLVPSVLCLLYANAHRLCLAEERHNHNGWSLLQCMPTHIKWPFLLPSDHTFPWSLHLPICPDHNCIHFLSPPLSKVPLVSLISAAGLALVSLPSACSLIPVSSAAARPVSGCSGRALTCALDLCLLPFPVRLFSPPWCSLTSLLSCRRKALNWTFAPRLHGNCSCQSQNGLPSGVSPQFLSY